MWVENGFRNVLPQILVMRKGFQSFNQKEKYFPVQYMWEAFESQKGSWRVFFAELQLLHI